MEDSFVAQETRSEVLKKHIAYYYFHQSTVVGSVKSFFYYPHYKNALTIYRNAKMHFNGPLSTVIESSGTEIIFGYTQLFKNAAKTEIHAPFDKIGVAFQPLGLNNFVKLEFSSLVAEPINLNFNHFLPSIKPVLQKVYSTNDIDEKVELLDKYFESIAIGFSEVRLEMAINLLIKNDKKYTVEELALEVKTSRKTLLRLFRKHLNCSVIDYIKLIQFRKAVDIFQSSFQKSTLSELAHKTDYYDQSEFIHHFKKLTGYNPKAFFKNISNIGTQGTYWTFD